MTAADNAQTRLGRIEGKLDIIITQMGVADDRTSKLQERVGALEVEGGRQAVRNSILSTVVSGVMAFIVASLTKTHT
jgi:hypothetical protein